MNSPAKIEEPAPAPARDSTTFADRIGLVVGGQFVSAIIGLLQGVLLVRWLDKRAYGTISLVLFLLATGRELGMLYLPESILYFAPKANRGELLGLLRQSMRLLAGLGVVVALILALLGLAPGIFLNGRTDLGALLVLAGLVSIVAFPSSAYGNLFIATDNHRRAAGISLFLTLLGAAGNLIPAALGWPVSIILWSMVVSAIVRIVLSERLVRQMFDGTNLVPFPGGVRAQFQYVLPLSITRFAGVFNQKLDRFIVGLFFGAESFAEFAIGSQELPLVSILPYTIASTMTPKLVELYESGKSRVEGARNAIAMWHAGMRKATIVMVPIAVFLLLAAEPFMVALYGEKYRAAALPFRLYSGLMLVRLTGYGTMLMAFGRTKELMRIQIVGMVVNVSASFFLLPRIGMIAAPLGAVFTQLSMIVMILMRVNAQAHVGVRGIFPWSHWLRTVLAAAIAAAVSGAVLWLLSSRTPVAVQLVASVLTFVPPYVICANVFGVLTAEDRAFIRRWVRLEPLRTKPNP
ncbi:MAG TPA: oligosaccharide flippase family protein [Polyangium sp.]|nr:oligosaccharide flippase family protein [Polyangium sp.]